MSSTLPPLKPMSAGDILDRAIRIYRENFVPLIIITAIVVLPVTLLQALGFVFLLPLDNLFVNPSSFDPETFDPTVFMGPVIALSIVASLVGAFATLFQWGALTSFVSERFLGRPITVGQSYRNAFRRWLALLIAAILLVLVFFVAYVALAILIVIPIVAISALSGGSSDAIGAGVGFAILCLCVFLLPAGLALAFLFTRWSLWVQAIICENYNSTGGLGRSWKLTKGSVIRIFLFLLALGVLVVAVTYGLTFAVSFATIFIGSVTFQFILQTMIGALVSLAVIPLQSAVLTVLYYDLRIRKEGFDLQMQMQGPTAGTDLPSLIPGAG